MSDLHVEKNKLVRIPPEDIQNRLDAEDEKETPPAKKRKIEKANDSTSDSNGSEGGLVISRVKNLSFVSK